MNKSLIYLEKVEIKFQYVEKEDLFEKQNKIKNTRKMNKDSLTT